MNWKQWILLLSAGLVAGYINYSTFDYVVSLFDNHTIGLFVAPFSSIGIAYLIGLIAGRNAWRLK